MSSSSAASLFLQRIRRRVIRTVATVTVGGIFIEITTKLPSEGRSSDLYHAIADQWITPFMRRWLDPEVAHNVAIYLAKIGLCPQYRPSAIEQRVDMTMTNLHSNNSMVFSSPIGLAAGFDKDGMIIPSMILLGFGFVEVGTVTPQPQEGNPKPRMFRLIDDNAIINRYGFNSSGAENVLRNLKYYRTIQQQSYHNTFHETALSWYNRLYYLLPSVKRQQKQIQQGVVGVNIGKNISSVTDDGTIQDYVSNIKAFTPFADYIVVNISSPNTDGLRDWQNTNQLQSLLTSCIRARDESMLSSDKKTPILVKLSPDLNEQELNDIANVCMKYGIDGIIVSNTTNQRSHDLISAHHIQKESGGLSGKPLRDRSTECIRILYKATNGGTIPIIGVGGISNGYDAYEKFKAGASLVQIYSSLIYEGPGIVRRIRKELAQILIENGQRSLQKDVIGLDHDDIFWQRQQEKLKEIEAKVKIVVIDQQDDGDINDDMPSTLLSVQDVDDDVHDDMPMDATFSTSRYASTNVAENTHQTK